MAGVEAASKFGYKRKKKHTYTEEGIPIEPFNIREDVASGLLSKEGYLQNSLRDHENKDRDAWLDTIQED